MQGAEARCFEQGMPVAALMEKAGLALAARIGHHYPAARFPRVGVLAGPGHNGGDALVVARELYLAGRQVSVCCPLSGGRELTLGHRRYFESLGGTVHDGLDGWPAVDLWVDGLFGFGLGRPVTGAAAQAIAQVQAAAVPIVALDLPSGLASDSGAVLGTAIRAERTLCLGFWKRGLWQEQALPYTGICTLIDLGLALPEPLSPETPRLLGRSVALAGLPLARSPIAHKYTVGSLLLVAGCRRYGGAPQLAALGARAAGPGMLTLAVPESLVATMRLRFSEAILLPCPETDDGILAGLDTDLARPGALCFGPGLGHFDRRILEAVVANHPGVLVLDADGLNALAGQLSLLERRPGPTVLTPHLGEFRRLFPDLDPGDRFNAAAMAARSSGAWVVLKGARTVIAAPTGETWVNPHASSALARGGSGDVLAGLIAGLACQTRDAQHAVLAAVWWHARTGLWLAERRSVLGVTPEQLALGLIPFLSRQLASPPPPDPAQGQ